MRDVLRGALIAPGETTVYDFDTYASRRKDARMSCTLNVGRKAGAFCIKEAA